MKALTLTQPWATLVAIGAKRIETRSWSTAYRGPLAIHAAKGMPREAIGFCFTPLFTDALLRAGYRFPRRDLPFGAVVAIVRLVGTRRTEDVAPQLAGTKELTFGDYTPGRYAWFFEYDGPLALPVAATGHLGLWEWTP